MLPWINSTYFQDLVESFTSGVLIINTRGEVYVANMLAANILGVPQCECVSRTWEELFQGIEEKDEFSQFMRRAVEMDCCNLTLQIRFERTDGTLLYLNVSSSPLTEHHKRFGIMILLHDVTHIYQMHRREKAILEDRNIAQRQHLESLNNLSTAIAHQIRNPMMAIGGFANLLLRRCTEDSQDRFMLEGIVDAAKRLEQIVTAVGSYTGLHLENSQSQPIEDIVLSAREVASLRLQEEERKLAWEIDLEKASIRGNRELLIQALNELFTNSLESIPNGDGRIRLHGRRLDTGYHLNIFDNGQGIAPDILPYVRDPFFTTKAVGVGMGLCNAERIIKEHQGTLDILSDTQEGTSVEIRLPLSG
jgi:PAS domain S-box-containing protein